MSKTEDKYTSFFEEIKKFKEKQQQQKQRGLNDFNLLSTVRNFHDEVYLHSTMIGALLDPKGLHYQDTLFVENFLDVLKLNDFELELDNITVLVEYHDIDLYITDGNKHIIIENKIWAADQPCQIIKYINIIKEENDLYVDDNKKIEDIYVLYLTPDDTKRVSSEHVIRNKYISFKIDGNDKLDECSKRANTKSLVPNGLKNYQVKYKKINYKDDILNWLRLCLEEVQNITNLNESIKQYINVVEMVNGNYKGKVVELKNLLLKNGNLKLMLNHEMENALNDSKTEVEKKFWIELKNELKDKSYDFEYVNHKFELQADLDGYINSNQKYYGLKYDISEMNTSYKLHFYIELENNITYGFTISENNIRKNISKDIDIGTRQQKIDSICNWTTNSKDKNNKWWIHWNYPKTKLNFKEFKSNAIFNLVDDLYNDGKNNIIKNLANEIDEVLENIKN